MPRVWSFTEELYGRHFVKLARILLRLSIGTSGVLSLIVIICWVSVASFVTHSIRFVTDNAPPIFLDVYVPDSTPVVNTVRNFNPDAMIPAVHTDIELGAQADGVAISRYVLDIRTDPTTFFTPSGRWTSWRPGSRYRSITDPYYNGLPGRYGITSRIFVLTGMKVRLNGEVVSLGDMQINSQVMTVRPHWWAITTGCALPWLLHVPFAAPRWYRRFKHKPGHCRKCNYDLTGLAKGAPCPECGGPGEAAEGTGT